MFFAGCGFHGLEEGVDIDFQSNFGLRGLARCESTAIVMVILVVGIVGIVGIGDIGGIVGRLWVFWCRSV